MQMEQPYNCAHSEAEDIPSRAVKNPCLDIIPSHQQYGLKSETLGNAAVNPQYSLQYCDRIQAVISHFKRQNKLGFLFNVMSLNTNLKKVSYYMLKFSK